MPREVSRDKMHFFNRHIDRIFNTHFFKTKILTRTKKTLQNGSTPFADISDLEKTDFAEKSDLRNVYQVT